MSMTEQEIRGVLNAVSEKVRKVRKDSLTAQARETCDKVLAELGRMTGALKCREIVVHSVEVIQPEPTETASIVKVMEAFQMKINPNISYGNRTQRLAALWLVKQHSLEAVLTAVEFISQHRDDPFAPVITTPYQLKEKLAQLIIYRDRLGQRQAKPTGVTEI